MPRITLTTSNTDLFSRMLAGTDTQLRAATGAGAKLLKTYTENLAGEMLSGPYSLGKTRESIITKQVAANAAIVTYSGTRPNNWNPPPLRGSDYASLKRKRSTNRKRKRGSKVKRAGEVAFVNEYGSYGRAARPFNRTAITENEDAILERMSEIFYKTI